MEKNWLVCETEFRRATIRPQESVFTIGNGYLSTRGAFEEGLLGDLPDRGTAAATGRNQDLQRLE